MMQIMLDTNIILDVFLQREPFFANSNHVFELCHKKLLQGFISASTITDIYYSLRKTLHNREFAYTVIGNLIKICEIAPVTDKNVKEAYLLHAKDFEDALLATCAKSQHCDYIVTRNKRDFVDFPVKAINPEEFLTILGL